RVSTPSGMMTIKEVPTRTPIPIVEISWSRDCDIANDRGKEPARKDLETISIKFQCVRREQKYAMAMTVLKVSSMNNPFNILTERPLFSL
ncbi:MAG: hypothetical protein Q9200_005026, partial [Gallowayella weberi]